MQPSIVVGLAPLILLIIIVTALVWFTTQARLRGYSGFGGDTIVRCRSGHVFTTIWVPGASLKAIRFGLARFQYCPVGNHWTLVTPVKDSDLSDKERRAAAINRDSNIP